MSKIATEVVTFLKIFKVGGSFEEIYGGKFAAECVRNGISSLKLFSELIIRFSAKIEKNFEVGKFRHYDEERVLFRKKNVFFKSPFYKNEEAENVLVVVGRLVLVDVRNEGDDVCEAEIPTKNSYSTES